MAKYKTPVDHYIWIIIPSFPKIVPNICTDSIGNMNRMLIEVTHDQNVLN